MAKPRQFARVDITRFIAQGQKITRAAQSANSAMQMELAQAGRDKMREYIETRGTRVDWQRAHRAKDKPPVGRYRRGSSPGRVNTGNMRDSVRARFETGPRRTIAAFGWIGRIGEDDEYFQHQDKGFFHVKKGVGIPGMFALRDARFHVTRRELPRVIRKYEKRIARGVIS